ncbi:putative TRAPP complex subunit [Aspergillus udagawae]|uniref:Trafficking protein particle complex subunit n=1 Tax=Aspergillus udagawae TaxID=91492 RepID=A0A8H3MXY1_9EURO|nr:putative TRAPP complex subunit [Aspergillus udagawae]
MVVYSFYIFDRHAECIYKRRWLPRPASIVGKSSRPTSEVATQNGVSSVFGQSARTTDDDAKLIFGTVFSLRNMVRKLGGEDDSFVTYRTSQYKLHYYETPTNIKFVMLTDVKSPSMRVALQQIYINLYVEYVVKNPLSPVEHPGGVGVNNELFEESLEQFVVSTVSLTVVEQTRGSHILFGTLSYLSIDPSPVLETDTRWIDRQKSLYVNIL